MSLSDRWTSNPHFGGWRIGMVSTCGRVCISAGPRLSNVVEFDFADSALDGYALPEGAEYEEYQTPFVRKIELDMGNRANIAYLRIDAETACGCYGGMLRCNLGDGWGFAAEGYCSRTRTFATRAEAYLDVLETVEAI